MKEENKKDGKYFENQIGNWLYKGLEITEEDIRRAMANTTSNMKAAEYLEVSYPTYKKYAKSYRDPETGKSLFQLHLNQAMKGIFSRGWVGGTKERVNWEKILTAGQKPFPERLMKLKNNLVVYKKLELECYRCSFKEKRVEDEKIPLLLNFKNGDKSDWRIQNMEFVCYNCSFLHCLDFFEDSVVNKVEMIAMNLPQAKLEKKQFYQLDDFYVDHIKKLGMEVSSLNKESVEKADSKRKEVDKPNKEDYSDFIDYV
jgi:hypothetical protein